MSITYGFNMGKENGSPGESVVDSEMFRQVTQIRRYYHLIDVCYLMDRPGQASVYKNHALKKGLVIVSSAEIDERHKDDLDRTLTWLKGRDHEMYGHVTSVLDHAQAVRNIAKGSMNGNGHTS